MSATNSLRTLCGKCGLPRNAEPNDAERRAVAAGVPLNVFRGFVRFRNDPVIVAAINKRTAELAAPAPAPDLGAAINAARGQTPESRRATLVSTLSRHSEIGQAPSEPTIASAPAPADLSEAIRKARRT
jgi:hypothetical protein